MYSGSAIMPHAISYAYVVHHRGVGLAFGLAHDLADEETERFVFTLGIALRRLRVGGEHRVDDRLQRAGVGDLREPVRGTMASGALPGLEHFGKDLLGLRHVDLPVSTSAMSAANPRGVMGDSRRRAARIIQQAEQFAHRPIGDGFGCGAELHGRIDEIGDRLVGRQYAGIMRRQTVLLAEARAARRGQFRQAGAQLRSGSPR